MIRSASQRAKGAGGYMSDFPSGAICVVGLAKVANQNPIHSVHRALAGSFIVDPSSGLVYDVQFDTVCQITSDFLASLLIGLSTMPSPEPSMMMNPTRARKEPMDS